MKTFWTKCYIYIYIDHDVFCVGANKIIIEIIQRKTE